MFAQNLQQSRGFGNNFKFPGEGGPGAPGAPATGAPPSSNVGFTNEDGDDDLYA
ncbi:AAA ATPase cdc48 [Stygiomarasmius scandens]